MQQCEYEEVKHCEDDDTKVYERKNTWMPLLKQILISSGIWSSCFQFGMVMGTPTVMIPQIRREANSTEIISDEEASWISSAAPYAMVPWIPILTAIASHYGRRAAHATVVGVSLAGYIAFYFSDKVFTILLSMCVLGITGGSVISIGILVITEYTSPEYRGVFLACKSACCFWGVWMANAIGTFFYWKNIVIFGFCCNLYNFLTIFAWPESPFWLAAQGRTKQSRNGFLWLRGHKNNKTELEELMQTKKFCKDSIGIWETVRSKWFYKPFLICLLCMIQFQLSGKLVISIYAIDIIKKITNSESNAYIGMLILDGVTVFGMYCGSYLARCIKRRVQLIAGTGGGIACLLLMSLYLYLVKHSYISENVYISVTLLSVSALSVSCGPCLLAVCLMGELLSIRKRSFCVTCASVCYGISLGTSIKIGLQIFKNFDTDGAFLYFGLSSIACLIVIYKYLPETKDKTLLEISQLFEDTKVER